MPLRQTLRVDRPFTGGMVTDTPPDALRADQSPYMENVVLSEGLAVERGGWTYVGADDPAAAGDEGFVAVKAARLQGRDEHDLFVTYGNGVVAVATDGAGGVLFDGGDVIYRPRAIFGGEVIWCPDDGVSPIRRTVATTASTTAGTGTYTVAEGSDLVTGSSTNFDPHVPVGSYLAGIYRVISRSSDTSLVISEKAGFTITARTTDPARWGFIGLKTLVTETGTASHTSSSTTVTGTGTDWASSGPGYGAVAVGDAIFQTTGAALSSVMGVDAIGSDTSLTVGANSVGAWSGVNYAILRSAVGREACVHRNRLWITGVAWAPNRLYLTPAPYTLGAVVNGESSPLTEAADAAQLFNVDIPAADADGTIVALTSGDDALYVHKTDSLYQVTGEWPALNVRKVADFGTRELRAAVAVDEGVFFAGTEGVFRLRGGSLDNLCEERGRRGGRLAEWRQQITRSTRCVVGVARGHLFISTGDATRECWVYDLRNDRWCGNFTSESGGSTGVEAAEYMDSARDVTLDAALEDVGTDRLFAATGNPAIQRVAAIETVIPDNPGGGVEVDDENLGRFRADTPTNVAGSTARQKRVVAAKVGYVLAGDDDMTLDVDSNVDEAATSTPEVSLPSGDGYDVETVRIPPTTGYIGRLGRSFQMSFRRSASPTSSSRVAVHFLELVVGERRPRA